MHCLVVVIGLYDWAQCRTARGAKNKTLLDSLNWLWDSSACLELFFPGTAFASSACDSVLTTCFCLFLVCVPVCHVLDVCVLRYPYDPMM